jgi:hypothetical protein
VGWPENGKPELTIAGLRHYYTYVQYQELIYLPMIVWAKLQAQLHCK